MYELKKVGDRTYYIHCPSRVGVFEYLPGKVLAIDSANDKEAGRRILRALHERGWELTTLINTHCHSDHIGGNAFLQQRTGCRIFAPDVDVALVNYPILKPTGLYGGFPYRELRGKFLMAQASNAQAITDLEPRELAERLVFADLGGHSFNQIGLRTDDGVWFIGDSVASAVTLDKYHIPFLYDVERYLTALETLETLEGSLFVASHSEPLEDVAQLAAVNRQKVYEIEGHLESICRLPKTPDEVIKAVFDLYGIAMTEEQYVLVGATLRSFLSYLKDAGRLIVEISDNRLMWKTP